MNAEFSVIFDIDGTLIRSNDFDGACYTAAAKEVLGEIGFSEEWTDYRHVTDAGILNQIVESHGLSNDGRLMAEVRAAFGRNITRYLADGGACEPVPGAVAAVDELLNSGLKVGIATGGWGHTAQMKLQHAGIPHQALVLVSSDDSMERVQIMETCLQRLEGEAKQAVYVGDALWDIEACANLGWRFIGVGERLKGKCQLWVEHFLDPAWAMMPNQALQSDAPALRAGVPSLTSFARRR